MKQHVSNTDYLIINIAKSLELCSESDGYFYILKLLHFESLPVLHKTT